MTLSLKEGGRSLSDGIRRGDFPFLKSFFPEYPPLGVS